MKDSLLIVLFFIAGLLSSYYGLLPSFLLNDEISTYILYLLMFVVGVGMGSDKDAFKVLQKANWKILLVPFSVVLGSLGASALLSFFLNDITVREGMAVGAGFGYYSLSSVLIKELHNNTIGTIGLLANVMRELITLLSAPILVYLFGKLAPISAGGATAMDTTLPIITRYSGAEYGIIAIFSGVVLTILVPFIVTLILTFQF